MSRPVPDLYAEQEVDFGRYWRALVVRWWLPVVGIVAGAIIGALVTLGGSSNWKATAQVYLGNALTPGGGSPVFSVPTSLGLVENYVQAESTIRDVAAKVGLKAARLRHHITTKPIVGVTGAKLGTPAPLLAITVTGSPPAKIAAAANELGRRSAQRLSGYVEVKITQLREHLAFDQRQLAQVVEQIASATQQQRQILSDTTLGASERLIGLQGINQLLQFSQQRQANLEQDQFAIRQLLKLAQDVEAGQVTARAVATRASGPSRRTAVAIGAFIGLILGIFAALVWEPLVVRTRPTQQQDG